MSSPKEPPVTPPERPARRRAPSLVLVNTGDGKGKSTEIGRAHV